MAVEVLLPILAREAEDHARLVADVSVDVLQAGQDRVERQLTHKPEVEILREAVVAEVAPLDRRASLERQPAAESGARQPDEEPRQAVVTLEHGLRDAAAASACEAI